jgi:acyl-CoA synthetase (AMP-forming)/AMP-acid ligase II
MMGTEHATLIDGLRRTARIYGDHGIRFYSSTEESTFLSFSELDERARSIAAALVGAGYGVGDTAVIAVGPGLVWAEAAWGALYAGLAFVPAPVAGYGPPAHMAETIAGIAIAADASVLITEQSVYATLGGSLPGVGIPAVYLTQLIKSGEARDWRAPGIDGGTTAYLLFTSGSTGDPKGVIATHSMVLAVAAANIDLFGSGPDAVMVGWAPMHHIMGLLVQVIIPAVNGAHAVVTSTEQFQRRPVFWLQLISRHRGTMSAAGNFAFALCTQLATDEQIADLDLTSLTSLFSGSEPVRPETVRAFVKRFASTGVTERMISPAMGMTESTLMTAKFPEDDLVIRRFDASALESGHLHPASGDGTVEWVSCGRPNSDTTIMIVDPDTLIPVEDGVVGEIWVAGPMVSPGYFRRPDATAEAFGQKLPGDDRSYLRSGDLGALLDGQLYVTGRLKDMIIIRGRNLYPQDIEAAALAHSPVVGISAAFEVVNHPNPVALVAEYDPEALAGAGSDISQIAQSVRGELMARFSLPGLAVVFIAPGTLPRTGTGKVRRAPTRAALESGALIERHRIGLTERVTA